MEIIPETSLYMYKGKPYEILLRIKFKVFGYWLPIIVYQCMYENSDGMVWARFENEFFKLFKKV